MPVLESNMEKLSLNFMQFQCELAKSDAPKSVQKREKTAWSIAQGSSGAPRA